MSLSHAIFAATASDPFMLKQNVEWILVKKTERLKKASTERIYNSSVLRIAYIESILNNHRHTHKDYYSRL